MNWVSFKILESLSSTRNGLVFTASRVWIRLTSSRFNNVQMVFFFWSFWCGLDYFFMRKIYCLPSFHFFSSHIFILNSFLCVLIIYDLKCARWCCDLIVVRNESTRPSKCVCNSWFFFCLILKRIVIRT